MPRLVRILHNTKPVLDASFNGATVAKANLSVCMIVRNEERYLKRAIGSVKNVARELVVVDTGSTDSTVEIARSASAQVLSFPWTKDFSAARNHSIEAATSDWILVIDADEELCTESIPALYAACKDPEAAAFSLIIDNRSETHTRVQRIHHGVRLFRNLPEIRFEGRIHEQVAQSAARTGRSIKFAPITLFHYGYVQDSALLKEKFKRNYSLLLAEAEEHPESPYPLCHLAHAELLLEQTSKAIERYQRALELLEREGGIPEQRPFWAGAYDGLIRAQMISGELEQALVTCRRGQRYFLAYAELIYLEGLCNAQLMRHAQAKKAFERCLALHGRAWMAPGSDPTLTDTSAHEGLAKACMALGNMPETLHHAQSVVRADPTNVSAWSLLGFSALSLNKIEEAALGFEKVLMLCPDQEMPQVLAVFLGCCLERREVERARKILEKQKNWSASPVIRAQHLLLKIIRGDTIEASDVTAVQPDEIARQWPHLIERLLLGGAVDEIERILHALEAITIYAPQITFPLTELFSRYRLSEAVDWTKACSRRVASSSHR